LKRRYAGFRQLSTFKGRSAGVRQLSTFNFQLSTFKAQASVLIALLWCLALLSIIVIGVLHTSRIDLMVGKNYSDRIQAHYLALAGIEKAKALLYQDGRQRSRAGKNHTGELYDSPENFRDAPLGRGQFRVLRRGRADEGGGIIFGVSDEESRLNVNEAWPEELNKLDGMTPDVVAAILDWRDADNEVTPGGAEAEYYLSLQPPCLPRNGPFQTVRELLMVRGVSSQLLLGDDTHQNGMLDSDDESGAAPAAGFQDLGWAGILTVDSSVNNVNASGEDRINVQKADEGSLTSVHGITSEIARAIVSYRGKNRFQSIADLLDVTAPQTQNQSGLQGNTRGKQGGQNQQAQPADGSEANQSGSNPTGPKVINANLLMDIADELTVADQDLAGMVNINSASLEVLLCLPGLNRQLAQAIISYRQSNGFLPNIAHLLKVPGITTDILKQVGPRVTARSETFRILAEGRVPSSGTRQRIQEIVHVGLHSLKTVSYREDDL
jgi:competence ComEA-like helix-hairpin-helix protein